MRRLRGDADISTRPDLDNANGGNENTVYLVRERTLWVRSFLLTAVPQNGLAS